MPIRAIITQGTTADCTQAKQLIDGIPAKHLLADRGYDSNAIVEQAIAQGMNPVIPPKRNRKIQRDYDQEIYKNPLQNFRLDKYFGLFEGYAETLRGNCSDFRQIDQY
jgi:transposase